MIDHGGPTTTEPEHEITATYTNDDDGVWLVCSCWTGTGAGWRRGLGFSPTIDAILAAAAEHPQGARRRTDDR